MLFNSFEFLFLFLPLSLALSKLLRGQKLLAWITLSSFVFYAFAGHAWFLIPILVTVVLDFFLAQRIYAAGTQRKKNILLVLSLFGNLGMLFYFKYAPLFLKTGRQIFGFSDHWVALFDVVLPAGISFYTFQTLSYIIDVWRGHAPPERNFFKFAGFVSFFPHLVAGPLTRHNQLIPGLEEIARVGVKSRWEEGLFLFFLGLSKKVLIADRIAQFIDPVINRIGDAGLIGAWMALLGYTLQIYFDFSGYSDMAIGLGRLFGIELPKNFNSPYRALDPSDFWKRWHITLSQWLRDYLYVPVVNLLVRSGRTPESARNIGRFVTMVLGGLWHGANWTFAAWGIYHGLLLMVFHRFRDRWSQWPRSFQQFVTFVAVCFSWVFFRAPGFPEAWKWFGGLFGLRGLGPFSSEQAGLAALLGIGLVIAHGLPNASHFEGFSRLPRLAHAALGTIAAVALLFMNYSSKFLYFQF